VLINCVADQDGKKPADCLIDEIGEYLERPGCVVWGARRDASAEALSKTGVFMAWRWRQAKSL
jgi:magnesium transporter